MDYTNQYGEVIAIPVADEVWLDDEFFAKEMAKLQPDAPRAGLAYRVSTKGQVDHDDIPMQKIECRKFCVQHGWRVVEEKAEKGVCALPGFVDSKNEEKTERNAGYLVVSQSGGGMLRQGTRKGIRRTPANRGMRAHRIVKGLDISEDVCHGMCP